MKHGFVVPFASEQEFVELAQRGEQAGWDAVFSWEGVWRQDAWVQLGAAAVKTERIRLGTVITPVSRYRPWDLASLTGSVDRLSDGRVILGVGLGALNSNWTTFEGESDRRTRAHQLDDGLAVWSQLSAGEPFRFDGEHYQVDTTTDLEPGGPPPTTQRPHPPVWAVGALVPDRDRQRSLERAARWEGIFPCMAGGPEGYSTLDHDSLREIVARLRDLRAEAGLPWKGYDVVVEGDTHGSFGDNHDVAGWEDAGATWWVESWWDVDGTPAGVDELRRRVAAGPSR